MLSIFDNIFRNSDTHPLTHTKGNWKCKCVILQKLSPFFIVCPSAHELSSLLSRVSNTSWSLIRWFCLIEKYGIRISICHTSQINFVPTSFIDFYLFADRSLEITTPLAETTCFSNFSKQKAFQQQQFIVART